jgi:phenylacetic acid degradation operon negative regulatory protein
MQNPVRHISSFGPAVLRRGATVAFIDLLTYYGEALLTRGRSCWHPFESTTARRAALRRLEKDGVIAYRRSRDREPVLVVTGRHAENLAHDPRPWWNARWDGLWRVLVYDVPETNRAFRRGIRRLLERYRMGLLQQSVWISPRDIRPEYDDLQKAIGIEHVSYLFEARTVLGRDAQELVRNAWDMPELESRQQQFLDQVAGWDETAKNATNAEALLTLAAQEMEAYLQCMRDDPLLPRSLAPQGYLGFAAFKTHLDFTHCLRKALKTARPHVT